MILGQDPTIGRLLGVGPSVSQAPSVGTHPLPDATIGALAGGVVDPPADVWGRVTFPAKAPTGPYAAGDDAIATYLAFLKAYLQTDGELTALWGAYGVAPRQPVVLGTHAHNPSDAHDDHRGQGFNTRDLPALYLWRDSSHFERIAEDWDLDQATWKLLWVYSAEVQSQQRARVAFANAIGKAIYAGLERGRTPSFVIPGDPDPVAKRFGSFVHDFTNVVRIHATDARRALLRVSSVDAAKPDNMYPAVEVTFEVEERLVQDPRIWTYPAGLEETVSVGTASVTGRK